MRIIAATLATAAIAFGILSATVEEDSPLFNCYLNGNHQCGSAPHTLGFIND